MTELEEPVSSLGRFPFHDCDDHAQALKGAFPLRAFLLTFVLRSIFKLNLIKPQFGIIQASLEILFCTEATNPVLTRTEVSQRLGKLLR